jgi:ubiquinone/menaquinone biosynthesis C-methylase UbiE
MNGPDAAALAAANSYETNIVPYVMEPCAVLLVERADPQPGERVVDVAAGTGIVARLVAPRAGASGRVVAVDANPAMLAVGCATQAPEGAAIEWREGDAHCLPLGDAEFDLALCQHGLQYFSDCPAALREMRRVVKPSGRIAICVWQSMEHDPVGQVIWPTIARYLEARPEALVPAYRWGDAAALSQVIEGAGFRSVVVSPCSLQIRRPYGPTYVANLVAGVRKLFPVLDAMSDEERATLVKRVESEVAPHLHRYVEDGHLNAPDGLHIAVAQA